MKKLLLILTTITIVVFSSTELSFAQSESELRNEIDLAPNGYRKGEAIFKLFIYYLNNNTSKAIEVSEDIRSIAVNAKNDTTMCRYYQAMELYYSYTGDPRKTKEFAQKLYAHAVKSNNLKFQAICLLNKGVEFDELGNSKKSIENYIKCIPMLESCKDTANLIFAYLNYGVAEAHLGNNIMARKKLEYCIQLGQKLPKISNALMYAYSQYGSLLANSDSKNPRLLGILDTTIAYGQTMNNKTIQIEALNLLTQLYSENHQFSKAYETALKVNKLAKEIPHTFYEIVSSIDCAETGSALGITDSCYIFLRNAIDLAIKTKNNNQLVRAYSTLGNLYLNEDSITSGKKFLLMAHKLYQKLGMYDFNYNGNIERLVTLYNKLKMYDSSSFYLKLLNENTKQSKFSKDKLDYNQKLAELNLLSGDSSKAVALLDSTLNALDTNDFHPRAEVLANIETKYKVREKEVLLKQANQLTAIEKKNKNIFFAMLLASILLLGGLGYTYLRVINQKKIIEDEKKNIETLQNVMKHETLRQFGDIANVASQIPTSKNPIRQSQKLVARIRAYNSLYESLFSSSKKNELSLSLAIEQLFVDNCAGMETKPKLNITGDLLLNFKKSEYLILALNELIANSIEHAFVNFDNAIIKIDISKSDSLNIIEYQDNGKGISDDKRIIVPNKGMRQIATLVNNNLKGSLTEFNNEIGSYYKITFNP